MSDLFKNLDTAFSWIGMRGSILLALSILTSCSQTDDIPEQQQGTPAEEVVTDTRLRLSSIGELENISTESIPGAENYRGWQLESLTYNCIDTIEQRALLMDVEATLISETNREVTLRFLSEVGPELVSVEYYPKVEVVAAHHNMLHGVYPRVERYRNYSDGSRIGPDVFYDYGHPVENFVMYNSSSPGRISCDDYLLQVSPESWTGTDLNPEKYFVENGKYCQYCKTETGYYNSNAFAYNSVGEYFNGDDLFPSEYKSIPYAASSASTIEYSKIKNDFYGIDEHGRAIYMLSRGYDPDDDTTRLALNLCRDVPIARGTPYFPDDTHNLNPGFYFCGVEAYNDILYGFTSRYYTAATNDKELVQGLRNYADFYSQYMIIDGRLVHFNDICDIKLANVRHHVSKAENHIQLRLETEWRMYGEIFMSRGDLYLYKKDGPEELVMDARNTNGLDSNDQSELDKAKSRTRATAVSSKPESSNNGLIPRHDGKTVKMDTTLPSSIQSMPRSRTIKTM